MNDFDDKAFAQSEESSDNERFSLDDHEDEDFAEDSAASDASDLAQGSPRAKKAPMSRTHSAITSSNPPARPNSRSSSFPVNPMAIPKSVIAKAKDPATKSSADPKPKSMTAENAETAVLDYMRKTNRPYSLLNVFENMHRTIAKTSLMKLLDNLVIKQELVSKTYGKAKIYYVNQNNWPMPSENERLAIEEQLKAVTADCTGLEQELKSTEATLASVTCQISDADLDAVLKQLDEEIKCLKKRAEVLAQPGRAPVSPGKKDALKRKFTAYRTAWVARKRLAMDGVNEIADGMEKKAKVVLELIGFETDEEVGVKELPSL